MFFATKVNCFTFFECPHLSLSTPLPLKFSKKINGPLVGENATEHVGPKILCLVTIGAEISQVRFDVKKNLKNQRRKTTLSFPAVISFVYIIAA